MTVGRSVCEVDADGPGVACGGCPGGGVAGVVDGAELDECLARGALTARVAPAVATTRSCRRLWRSRIRSRRRPDPAGRAGRGDGHRRPLPAQRSAPDDRLGRRGAVDLYGGRSADPCPGRDVAGVVDGADSPASRPRRRSGVRRRRRRRPDRAAVGRRVVLVSGDSGPVGVGGGGRRHGHRRRALPGGGSTAHRGRRGRRSAVDGDQLRHPSRRVAGAIHGSEANQCLSFHADRIRGATHRRRPARAGIRRLTVLVVVDAGVAVSSSFPPTLSRRRRSAIRPSHPRRADPTARCGRSVRWTSSTRR